MRPVGLKCRLVQPDWLLDDPEVEPLPELEVLGLDDPPDELEGSDELCACAPNTRHAAQNTTNLSNCFLINLPFLLLPCCVHGRPTPDGMTIAAETNYGRPLSTQMGQIHQTHLGGLLRGLSRTAIEFGRLAAPTRPKAAPSPPWEERPSQFSRTFKAARASSKSAGRGASKRRRWPVPGWIKARWKECNIWRGAR
jgi:hypothetical protein